MVSMLACPRCSELPSVWLSNRFFMMAMVCSTNWVFVSLIGTWTHTQKKKNPSGVQKTQSLPRFGPKCPTKPPTTSSPTADNSVPFTRIPILDVIFDKYLFFGPPCQHIIIKAFFHLKTIDHLCPSLPFSAADTLMHVFITSRLDDCNKILSSSTSQVRNKLKQPQNSGDDITPSFRSTTASQALKTHFWIRCTQKGVHDTVAKYKKIKD